MAKISDICISMKSDDYLQLPDITYDDVPVILDARAQKAYTELERKMVLQLDQEKVIDVTTAAGLSNKLQQLANGAIYDEDRSWVPVHDCKIEAFMELIEQLNGKSALVFYNFRHDLDDAERFAEKVLKYLWDDAFKLGRKELFNDCSQGLSAVIEAYEDAAKAKIEKQSAEDPLKKVLVPAVYDEMQKKMAEMAAEAQAKAAKEVSEEEAAESAAEDNPAQKPAGEE